MDNTHATVLPAQVSWPEVYRLALEQEVAAVAFDGLRSICSAQAGSGACMSLGKEKFQWMLQKVTQEQNYNKQKKVIAGLSELWSRGGLEALVLKGHAFARYYPIPEHRFCGDFDFYVRHVDEPDSDANASKAWRKADALIREKGVAVDDTMAKHSVCTVSGVAIENHRHLIEVRGSRHWKDLDDYLRRLLTEDTSPVDGIPGLRYPSWLFDALFLLIHARKHFLIEEGITLRLVMDWALIRRQINTKAREDAFLQAIRHVGIQDFHQALDGVADFVTGKKLTLSREQARVLEDILSKKEAINRGPSLKDHVGIVRLIWGNRWKFRKYSDVPMITVLGRYLRGYFFEKDYELKFRK